MWCFVGWVDTCIGYPRLPQSPCRIDNTDSVFGEGKGEIVRGVYRLTGFQRSESLLTLRSLVNEGELSRYFSINTFANKIVLEPIEDSESTSDLVPLAVLLAAVIDQRHLPTCRLSDTGSTDHDLPLLCRPLFSNERYLRSSSTRESKDPRQYYATWSTGSWP